jgi:hypothetical protein
MLIHRREFTCVSWEAVHQQLWSTKPWTRQVSKSLSCVMTSVQFMLYPACPMNPHACHLISVSQNLVESKWSIAVQLKILTKILIVFSNGPEYTEPFKNSQLLVNYVLDVCKQNYFFFKLMFIYFGQGEARRHVTTLQDIFQALKFWNYSVSFRNWAAI